MTAVRQIAVPGWARGLTALGSVDYEDAFVVEAPTAGPRAAVDWARAVLEGAPERLRHEVRDAWSVLGLQLEPPGRDDAVLGWRLWREESELAILAASSPLGIRGELLFARRPAGCLYATFVSLADEEARRVWAKVEPAHPPVVRQLLELAAARDAAGGCR
ncbi:MAG TPA: hypothetical protein VGH14_09230 [Solirubrobacterales bacterium]